MAKLFYSIKFLLRRESLTRRLATLLLFLLAFLPLPASAAEDDIRLIIDISGSMKKNDPKNLRIPAINLLVKLIPKGASAGVWVFGQDVKMLVPHGKVDATWKKNAMVKIRNIDSSGLYTNIGAALEQVMLDDDRKRGATAILLTDGMVDISKDKAVNVREQQRIIRVLLPALVSAGSQVHTVALSENADAMLMRELALSTGGMFDTASNADDLTRIFLRMFDDAVSQDRLPLDHGKFVVDSSVEEFTLLIFRTADQIPAQLRDPAGNFFLDGSRTDSVNWYSDTGYELITALQPLEGEWQLFADDNAQNRVTVLSDLKLAVSNLPNTIYEGDVPEIFISFRNEGQLVTDTKFLTLMDVQLIIEKPDGKRVGAKLPMTGQGVYQSKLDLLDKTGRYQIMVSVDGKTFKRENVQEVQYEKPVKVEYLAAERILKVIPVSQALFIDKINVMATITAKGGKKRLLPLQMTDSLWQGSLDFFKQGKYRISLRVKGQSSIGQKVDFVMPPMIIRIDGTNAGIAEVVNTDNTAKAEGGADLESVDVENSDDEGVDPDIMTLLKTYWVYLVGVLVSLILIIGAVWFLLRRRKVAAASETAVVEPEAVVEEPPEAEEASEEDEEDFGTGMSDIVDAWGDDPLENLDSETDKPVAETAPKSPDDAPDDALKDDAPNDDTEADTKVDSEAEIGDDAEKSADPEAMFMPDGLTDDEPIAGPDDETSEPVETVPEDPPLEEPSPEEKVPDDKPKPTEEPLMADAEISQLIKDELPESEQEEEPEEEPEQLKEPDDPVEAASEAVSTGPAESEDQQEDWDEQDELASTQVMTPEKNLK